MKIVLGDFNAKIGKESFMGGVAGKFTLHEETSENGILLGQFAARNKLHIKSTMFPHKNIHLGTWRIPGTNNTNQIDHVLTSVRCSSSITDVKSCRGPNCDSDHYLIRVKLRERINSIKKNDTNKKKHWNIQKVMKDQKIRMEYQKEISERVEKDINLEDLQNVDDHWKKIKNIILEAAEGKVGEKEKIKRNEWFDADCMKAIENKNNARRAMIQRETRGRSEKYHELRLVANKICRKKKKEWLNGQLNVINELHGQNERRKMYFALKCQSNAFRPKINGCKTKDGMIIGEERLVMDRWTEYFSEMLNVVENDTQGLTPINIESSDDVSPPTVEEVRNCIKHMKNFKAPGMDHIVIELIKYGGEGVVKSIHELIKQIWRIETMPEEWNVGIICPIWKKGDKLNCNNYRGITLLNTAYKILSGLLTSRIRKAAEEFLGEYQCGFRPNKGTVDQLFVVRQIMEKFYEFDTDLHMLFIDFKQAFDSVKRDGLYSAMHRFGIPGKLIKLTQMTMAYTKASINIGGVTGNTFQFNTGVKQGDSLSAVLFNIALHGAVSSVDQRGTVFTKSTQICAYADDIVIIARTKNTLVRVTNELLQEANKVGLIVNETKTKYMVMSTSEERRRPQDLQVENRTFAGTESFVYLGNIINNKIDINQCIYRQIQNGNKAYFANLKILKSKLISRKIKIQVYKTLIRPIVVYGSETWVLSQGDENKLRSFEYRILRKIFGPVLDRGAWRIRYNFEIERLIEGENIVRFIKSKRIQWIGHVVRRNDMSLPKKIMKGKLYNNRGRGRPKLRWVNQVENDIKILGVHNWERKAAGAREWNIIVEKAKTHPGL